MYRPDHTKITNEEITSRFTIGLNCLVSMELIVSLDTPTFAASWLYDNFFSLHFLKVFS